jgi:hypothetical protein
MVGNVEAVVVALLGLQSLQIGGCPIPCFGDQLSRHDKLTIDSEPRPVLEGGVPNGFLGAVGQPSAPDRLVVVSFFRVFNIRVTRDTIIDFVGVFALLIFRCLACSRLTAISSACALESHPQDLRS